MTTVTRAALVQVLEITPEHDNAGQCDCQCTEAGSFLVKAVPEISGGFSRVCRDHLAAGVLSWSVRAEAPECLDHDSKGWHFCPKRGYVTNPK